MRGLHAEISQLSTTHNHHELTSSTLLSKAREAESSPPSLARSRPPEASAFSHFCHCTCKDGRFSILFLSYIFFGCVFKAGFFTEFEGSSFNYSRRIFCQSNDNWAILLLETFFLVTQWLRMIWALRRRWWEPLQRIRLRATWRCEITRAS